MLKHYYITVNRALSAVVGSLYDDFSIFPVLPAGLIGLLEVLNTTRKLQAVLLVAHVQIWANVFLDRLNLEVTRVGLIFQLKSRPQ